MLWSSVEGRRWRYSVELERLIVNGVEWGMEAGDWAGGLGEVSWCRVDGLE